jgi:hypothetical protein
MNEQISIYLGFWRKYRLPIQQKMKGAAQQQGDQEYQLYAHEFKALGTRIQVNYSFNLEISNGRVANNINGSAIARDLFEMLKMTDSTNALLDNNHFILKMGKDFKLKISCPSAATETQSEPAV